MDYIPFPVIDVRATGKNIECLRIDRGLTVKDLQLYFGFDTPSAIYQWQRGVALPNVDNLYALSALLKVSMNEIIIPYPADQWPFPSSPYGCPPLPSGSSPKTCSLRPSAYGQIFPV